MNEYVVIGRQDGKVAKWFAPAPSFDKAREYVLEEPGVTVALVLVTPIPEAPELQRA